MTPNLNSTPSIQSIWKRFSKNLISVAYSQLVTIAVQFAAIPFYLSQWGVATYAEWLIVTGLPTIITLLNPGVSQASATRAGMFAAKGNIAAAKRSTQTAFAFAIFIGIVLVSISTTLGLIINWEKFFHIKIIGNDSATIIFIITTAHLAIQILGNSLDAWFRAIDRTATGYFLLANRRMIDVIATIALLTQGAQPTEIATALLAGQIIFLAIIVIIAASKSPQKIIGLSHASTRELRIISKPSLAFMGMTTAQAFTLQGGIQWLHQVSSPELVVAYSLARTLMRLTIQIGIVTSNALRPELSRLNALKKYANSTKLARTVSIACILVASLAYLVLAFTGPKIIEVWGSGKVALNHFQLLIIGIHALLNVVWYMPATQIIASNNHSNISKAYALFSSASIIVFTIPVSHINPIYIAAAALAIPEIALIVVVLNSTKPKATT